MFYLQVDLTVTRAANLLVAVLVHQSIGEALTIEFSRAPDDCKEDLPVQEIAHHSAASRPAVNAVGVKPSVVDVDAVEAILLCGRIHIKDIITVAITVHCDGLALYQGGIAATVQPYLVGPTILARLEDGCACSAAWVLEPIQARVSGARERKIHPLIIVILVDQMKLIIESVHLA